MPAEPVPTERVPAERGAAEVVVTDLTWTPDARANPTLSRVGLRFAPGERVGLLGASGSGKSTLLQALSGVLQESGTGTMAGEVTIGGLAPGLVPGTAGLLLQEPFDAVVADTVGRDVAFGPENIGLTREHIWARVHAALDAVAFPFGPERRTGELSGGQAQRLSLAGALALRPQVLLLDEPTAMLDDEAAAAVRDVVLGVAREVGTTLVVAEHRIGPWLEHLDTLVVLAGGEVIAAGPVEDVLAQHREALLRAGIWLPGVPAPDPSSFPELVSSKHAEAQAGHAEAQYGRDGDRTRADELAFAEDLSVTLTPAPAPGESWKVRPPVMVLEGAGIQVGRGESVAVTGSSGAGKSTLLKALTGSLGRRRGVTRTGTVRLLGADPARLESRRLARGVAMVSQHPSRSVVRHTVLDEVLATSRALGLDADEDRATAVLGALRLDHLLSASPHQLSGGEQRRLSLAAAVLHEPDLLILDEPTVGQDRHTWAAVAGVLQAVAARGGGVLVASHDADLVRLCATRVHLDRATQPGQATQPARSTQLAKPPNRVRRAPASHAGPTALLLVALAAAVAGLTVRSVPSAVVGLSVLALALPFLVSTVREALIRTLPVLLAALSVGWSTWLLGAERSLVTALTETARILVMVGPGALVMAHIAPSRLGDDLAQRLRMPPRVVVACVVALQRLDHLRSLWDTLDDVRRLRGLGPGHSPVARVKHVVGLTFSLLVESLRAAQQTALAMDARGFAGAARRTWAQPSLWLRADTVAVVASAVLAAVVIAASLIAASLIG